jgi:hypothetical protein
MARHTFPYIPFTLPPTAPFPNGQIVLRPLVVTRLTAGNGKTFLCVAEVDSGADQCVFPISFAIALGLDPLKMKQQMTGGVGNTGNVTHYDDLTIEVGQLIDVGGTLTFSAKVTSKTYAAFTVGLESQGLGLLGEVGLFENYTVLLDYRKREFHIED